MEARHGEEIPNFHETNETYGEDNFYRHYFILKCSIWLLVYLLVRIAINSMFLLITQTVPHINLSYPQKQCEQNSVYRNHDTN